MKTAQQLIDFEKRIKAIFENGELPYLLHLCGGNEGQLAAIFSGVKPGDWILSTHRSHYHYLMAGGDEARLEQLIRDGRSMFVFDKKLNFVTSSIVSGLCCVASGIATSIKLKGSKNHVWCFIGDAGEDEGHFYEAVRWVDGHSLPCTFVIEDNDRSVDSSKTARRGHPSEVFWPPCVRRYFYTPVYPHAGTGTKTMVKFKPVKPRPFQ
jgi:pyruvate dehydrogenase E1 component alpha subunit